ncbi:MAG: hypothetical protein ACYS8Y_08590 [Planctomycetota bacterium]|jgi:hypothetical protein
MIKRTIYCEKQGCDRQHTEAFENQGFPQWAFIGGDIKATDKEGKQLTINLCPDCKGDLIRWLRGQI